MGYALNGRCGGVGGPSHGDGSRHYPVHDDLMVYRDVSIHAERAADASRPDPIYTVSVDEKPGVQALGLTAPDLPPVLGVA